MREPEDVVSIIKGLETDVQEIKTRQEIGGDSWIMYKNQTGNLYDINVPSIGSGANVRYLVTFTPLQGDILAASMLEWTATYSGTIDLAGHMGVNGSTNSWIICIGCFTGSSATNILGHVMVRSTQEGTISVQSL